MFGRQKTLSVATKNEVTVIIQHADHKENYHETFMLDLSKDHNFEYKGKRYNIPAQDTLHYKPSFWDFPKKLAIFYERHKTMAFFFDWFGLRKNASYEIGYVYWEGKPEPIKQPQDTAIDWSMIHHDLFKNTQVSQAFTDADHELKGSTPMKPIMWFLIAIILVVAVVTVISFLTSSGPNVQPVQNVTAPSGTPQPPIILR